MPALVVWFLGGLSTMLAGLVPRVLFALGIGFATFGGFTVAIESLKSDVMSRASGLPLVLVQVLSTTQVDKGLALIMSATLAVVALRTTMGALTRLTMKGTA